MEQEMRSLQRIVWAIPSASTIIAAAAIVISLLKF
jgi:hypothetical protein